MLEKYVVCSHLLPCSRAFLLRYLYFILSQISISFIMIGSGKCKIFLKICLLDIIIFFETRAHCFRVSVAMKRHSDHGCCYKIKHWGWLSISEIYPLSSLQNMVLQRKLRVLHLDILVAGRGREPLGMTWPAETSKLIPRDASSSKAHFHSNHHTRNISLVVLALCVDQAGHELIERHLSLPSECRD